MAAFPNAAVLNSAEHKQEKGTKASFAFPHFRKTKLCNYNKAGGCVYGDNCFFAHDRSELQTPVSLAKTSLCKAFMSGSCPHPSAACKFAHGKRELRRVMPGKEAVPVPPAAKADSRRRSNRSRKMSTSSSGSAAMPRKMSTSSSGSAAMPPEYDASTTDSLPALDPESQPESQPVCEDEGAPWESESTASSMGRCVSDGSVPEVPPVNFSEDKAGPTPKTCNPVVANSVCNEKMSHFVREVGSAALPAFVWQGCIFLGDVQDVLLDAQPEYYED